MKRITLAWALTLCSFITFIACSSPDVGERSVSIIPAPAQMTVGEGTFTIHPGIEIGYADESLKGMGELLSNEIEKLSGIKLASASDKESNCIIFLELTDPKEFADLPKAYGLSPKDSVPVDESYSLSIQKRNIYIKATTLEGIYRSITTLKQIVGGNLQPGGEKIYLPLLEVKDSPRFAWRGLSFDVSRCFFDPEEVKQVIDMVALYKMNVLHMHLSDNQGWRIEIKKYPELTQIGSKRKETVIGHNSGTYDGKEYGGFYTQDQIRDVINYAAERHITIIPEIDMPGHASAASKAYPEFSGGGSPKYPGYTFNPGKDSVYTYLTDILKEVDALFPSQVIHLGGDEVHYGNQDWNTNKDIQDLMKHEKMKNLKDVENYFFQRMADSLLLIHNKVAAWDEVADSQLSPEHTIVFFWRQNRPEQLQKSLDRKFNIVLCPRLPMYLDYAQDTLQVHGVDWRKFSYNSYQKVYSFSPQDIPVKYPKNCNILGIQANLWTERIETEDRLDYMLFPRMAALAENAWTKEKNKNINSFNIRLKKQFNLYKKDHIYYSDPFTPKETGEPVR